jgi:hypothetical protein
MPIKNEPYPNDLVIHLDLYEPKLQQLLDEAYWNDTTDEVEQLQQRINHVKWLRDIGDEFYTRF